MYAGTSRLETVGVLTNSSDDDNDAFEMGISIEPDETFDSCNFGLNDSNLSDEQILETRKLLKEYKDLFQWGNGPLTCAHTYEHEIRLVPGAKPVKHKNRRFSEDQQKIINEEVEKLLKQGIIEKSSTFFEKKRM